MTLVIKLAIVILFITVVVNLFRAMFSMLNQDPNKPPMSHFIGRRLLYSAALIIILVLSLAFGLIEPNTRPY